MKVDAVNNKNRRTSLRLKLSDKMYNKRQETDACYNCSKLNHKLKNCNASVNQLLAIMNFFFKNESSVINNIVTNQCQAMIKMQVSNEAITITDMLTEKDLTQQ